MTPSHYKPKRPRACISTAIQITPDGKRQPVPKFWALLGQTRSIHALRRTLRTIMPAPKEFGRLAVFSLTVPDSE